MAKSNQTKSKTKKNSEIEKSNYDLIIAFLLFFIATIEILEAGYFGIFINDIFDLLFGEAAILASVYLIMLAVLILTKRLVPFFKSMPGIITNLVFFTSFYIYHLIFLYNERDVVNLNMYKELTTNDNVSHGAGIIVHAMDLLLFTLFGGVGIIIPAILLIVACVMLILNLEKVKELTATLENGDLSLKKPKAEVEEVKVKPKAKKAPTGFSDQDIDQLLSEDDFLETKPSMIFTDEQNEEVNSFYDKMSQPFSEDTQDIVEETSSEAFSALDFKKSLNGTTKFSVNSDVKADVVEEIVEEVIVEPISEVVEELVVTEGKKVTPKVGKYSIPPIDLLKTFDVKNSNVGAQNKFAKDKGDVLISTLASFKIKATIDKINIGPNIIKYELLPEVGTKVSKFSSLSSDIALALAASSVRIEAPIPGKSAIGIEIPNQKPKIIGLKEVLGSKLNDPKNLLQVGLGIDITGKPVFCDIKTTPHMLVAGSTGSGKSVCINSIIVSILAKAKPEEVKLVLVDPKKVELTPFNGIPHLLTPVVTDPKKAAYVLSKMVEEMEHRYELFAETSTRNILGYNEKVKDKLPYIVIIIDELADLMMVASKEVESSIARIAQMARAAGIHLIVATQRPSTDVITGLIKANIPTRVSFAVSSSIDSRTILDSIGAEKLLGKGDMLIMEQSSPNLVRLQGAYLSDDEVYSVVDYINSQGNEVEFVEFDMEEVNVENFGAGSDLDPLYESVKRDVINMQKASTSHIQRHYKVGYNRATTIMEQLESRGIVSPTEGTKPRRVLVREEDADIY